MKDGKKEGGNVFARMTGGITASYNDFMALDKKSKRVKVIDFLVKYALYIIIAILVIYVQYVSVNNPLMKRSFFSLKAIFDLVKRTGAAMFLALGVGGIIVLTGTDLSAGRILGLTACISASLLQMPFEQYKTKMYPDMAPWPILLVLLFVMLIGGLLGSFNGYCVASFKLHPFIVTLATQLIVYGGVLWYVTWGKNGGGPIAGLTEEYKNIVKGTVNLGDVEANGAAIPYYVFYAIIAAVIMWFIWNKTTLGKNMYAVGANPEAATVSGVSVMATTIMIFTLAGLMYGFGGFIEAARTGSNSPTTGLNMELDAIAACVIGGVSFTGGVGKISGVITGVFLLQIIAVSLQWLDVPTSVQYLTKGLIILVACALDMRKYLIKK